MGTLVHAVRSILRTPVFAAVVVLLLAGGIGVNVAILSVVDGILFRPLPYGDPQGLVYIHSVRSGSRGSLPVALLPRITATSIAEHVESIQALALVQSNVPDNPWRLAPLSVGGSDTDAVFHVGSHNLLSVLRVTPIAGRDFTARDASERQKVLLLTDEGWGRFFARSPDAIGRTVRLGAETWQIVGVLPPRFVFPTTARAERSDGVRLGAALLDPTSSPRATDAAVVGRLSSGATPEQARAEVSSLAEQLRHQHPDNPLLERPIEVQSIDEGLLGPYERYAWLLTATAWLVLLIAAVNISLLMLARGRAREFEWAIRRALGAPARSLALLTAIEVGMLAGVALGLAVAACSLTYSSIVGTLPIGIRSLSTPPVAWRPLVAAVLLTAAGGFIAALFPSFRALRLDLALTLRESSPLRPLRGGSSLLMIQTSIALVVMALALASVTSFARLLFADVGYVAADLHEVRLTHGYARNARSASPERVRATLRVLRAAPGVAAVGLTNRLPAGRTLLTNDDDWKARGFEGYRYGVSDGFFSATGTSVLAGREFDPADIERADPIAIVNQTAARYLWPAVALDEVVGRTVPATGEVVVGVVDDIRPHAADVAPPGLFVPITVADSPARGQSLIAAVRMARGTLLDGRVIDERLDRGVSPGDAEVTPVVDLIGPPLERPRFQAILLGTLAILAFALSSIAVNGVAQVNLGRRQLEFGVKAALGASRVRLVRDACGAVTRPVLRGVLLGVPVAWWSVDAVGKFLLDSELPVPIVIVGTVFSLGAAAMIAAALPIGRATHGALHALLRR